MKDFEFIDEHECKSMKNIDTIAIVKRYYKGSKRWFWEITIKGKHPTANEIKYCPYCGELLKNE